MNNLQALVDGMSRQWQRERAESQMTLGALIECLSALPRDGAVEGIGEAHSYRGYYEDLAFEKIGKRISVSDALRKCHDCMGKVFEGYKGGDFVMGENTPVWISEYSCCGEKLIGFDAEGNLLTEKDD